MKKRRVAAGYETKLVRTALAATLPLALTCVILLLSGGFSARAWWTAVAVIALSMFIATWLLRERAVTPLRTLSNLLSALREGDYSLRARSASPDDALGEAFIEANALRDLLQERRLEADAATALLREVLASIDSAIFVFDDALRLRLTNRAGERLLVRPSERLIGESAERLGLDELVLAEEERVTERTFPGAGGRFRIRSTPFRDRGRQHRLLLLEDLSRALREEERLAWQRLVRVIGHEIHNSLAPISSISDSLRRLISNDPLPHDWREDVERGLTVVGNRADALTRFTTAYARIAHLPVPALAPVDVGRLLARVSATETRVPVRVADGPATVVQADPDQLEQALINLLKNAAEASLERDGEVLVEWHTRAGAVEIRILDEGPGISGSENLFVPFFTTKPRGSGVGLVLARQIAEAHSGSVELRNRTDAEGCAATLTIPVG